MAVKNSQLADLIATTLEDLPKQEIEIMWDHPEYEFSRIYQTKRMEIESGTAITRRVMLDHTGAARYRRLYDTDEPTVNDVVQTITVPWTQIGTEYSWDRREILRNRQPAAFVDMIKTRRYDGLWSLANLIEERAWKTPTNASDDLFPYGVPYYLNMLNADTTGGDFLGQTIRFQDGSTSTTCAGLDASSNARWRNYAATYTAINAAFIDTFRIAFLRTRFKAPINVPDPSSESANSKRIYAGFQAVSEIMRLADSKDDNHTGKDIMSNVRMDPSGYAMINRLPVVYPGVELDGVTDPVTSTATDPVYCIDFSFFKPVTMADDWMHEEEPMTDRRQHTAYTIFLDGSHNNLCTNRRRAGFVIHKPVVT